MTTHQTGHLLIGREFTTLEAVKQARDDSYRMTTLYQ